MMSSSAFFTLAKDGRHIAPNINSETLQLTSIPCFVKQVPLTIPKYFKPVELERQSIVAQLPLLHPPSPGQGIAPKQLAVKSAPDASANKVPLQCILQFPSHNILSHHSNNLIPISQLLYALSHQDVCELKQAKRERRSAARKSVIPLVQPRHAVTLSYAIKLFNETTNPALGLVPLPCDDLQQLKHWRDQGTKKLKDAYTILITTAAGAIKNSTTVNSMKRSGVFDKVRSDELNETRSETHSAKMTAKLQNYGLFNPVEGREIDVFINGQFNPIEGCAIDLFIKAFRSFVGQVESANWEVRECK